jgi:peptide/nickel transport system substrate-binding protein
VPESPSSIALLKRMASRRGSLYNEVMESAHRAGSALALLITFAALLFLVSGVAAQGLREIRIGVGGVPSALDPASALDGATPLISRQVFETLVAYRDGSTDIEPGLATRWGISRDGLTWSFIIRENARFHDGTPLTARDVQASFERQMLATDPKHPERDAVWPALLRGLPGVVKTIRSPDAQTVQIVLVQPYAPLLTVLAHPGFGITRIVPSAEGGSRLVGTGPYRVSDIQPARVVLESVVSTPRRAERLVFVDIASENQAEAELDARTLDVWLPAGPPRRLEDALLLPGTDVGLLVAQTERRPFSSKKVRQALASALDPVMIGQSLERHAVPLQSFLPPGIWSRREGSPLMEANRNAGRAVLAQGLWPKDFTATLLVSDAVAGPSGPRVAESIVAALGAAGLPVRVRPEPPERVRALTQAGDYDLALVEVSLQGGDPHHFLYPLSATEAAQKGPGALNLSFYRNARLDDLLIRASQLAFRSERQRLYGRAQAMLADEMPWIPLYVRLRWAVVRPDVRGLRLHPTGLHRLDVLTLDAWSSSR